MGLLGTLIGGGIGFVMGGPLGAMIGGAIGSNLGGNQNRPRNSSPYGAARSAAFEDVSRRDPRQAQQAFMVAMISLAAKVAKADGRVTTAEIRSFDHFLKNNLGMSADDRKIASRIFNQAKDSPIPAEDFAHQIRDLLGHQPDRLRDLISLLMNIAMADGHFDPAEERLINSIATAMGLSSRDFEEAKAMFNPTASLDAAYATLGVASETEDREVKSAYRRLAKEYHPDVVANKGMGEDFQSFAAEKMRAINHAYDQVKDSRGF
ncbi:MAG: TerB family tellurite resistance protein [Gemmatimonadales bacterium]|nr:TerB family tellurite resistance protein [Gemmatimonadales bacterium]